MRWDGSMRLQLLTLIATAWALSGLAFPAYAQGALHDDSKSQSGVSKSTEATIPLEDEETTDAGSVIDKPETPDVAEKTPPTAAASPDSGVAFQDNSRPEVTGESPATLDDLQKAQPTSSPAAGDTPVQPARQQLATWSSTIPVACIKA